MKPSRVPILVVMIALAAKLAACSDAAELEAPPWALEEPLAPAINPPPSLPADDAPLDALAVRGALGLWSLQHGTGIVNVVETFKPLELRVELAGALSAPPSGVHVQGSSFARAASPAWTLIDDGRALLVELPAAARASSPADLHWIALEVTR
jgi:hypothetical protein